MKTVDNKSVMKVVNAMIEHSSTEYFQGMNCYVLGMDKGFLFYNDKTGCLYHGFSKVERPSYLSSEAQRSNGTINYTIGFDGTKLKACRLRTEKDFSEIYEQILNCE